MQTIYIITTDDKVKFYEQNDSEITPINSAIKYSLNDETIWTWIDSTIGNLNEKNIILISDTKIQAPTQIANNTNECDVTLLKTALNTIYNSQEVEIICNDETVISANNSEFPMYLIHPTKLILEINESSKIENKVSNSKTEKSSMKKTFERLNKNANYSKPL